MSRGTIFEEPLRVYAERYGVSVRTLEKWTGAPLDRPAELAAWWRENRKHRVPGWMAELEAGPGPGPEEEEREEREEPVDLDGVEGLTARETVEDLRKDLAACNQRKACAMRLGDATGARRWRLEASAIRKELRQWEKDLVKIETEQGNVATVAEISAALVPRLTNLKRRFEEALEGFLGREAVTDQAERRRLVVDALRDVYGKLEETRFLR